MQENSILNFDETYYLISKSGEHLAIIKTFGECCKIVSKLRAEGVKYTIYMKFCGGQYKDEIAFTFERIK